MRKEESAEHGARPRIEEAGEPEDIVHEDTAGGLLTLQLAFYACEGGLSGGSLELRLDEGAVDADDSADPPGAEEVPLTRTLTISWHT
jgi:hypothetical protein